MMQISVMSYTLASRPDLYALERYPEIIAAAGGHAVNWVTTYGESPERLRRLTLDAGLEVGAFTFALQSFRHGGSEREALQEAELRFAEAAALQAPVVMIVPMPIDGLDDRDELRRRWCGLLPQLALLAKKADTVLTIEDFEGEKSAFVTAGDLLTAYAAEPSLRFTFDIGNAAMGGDETAAAAALGGLISYVHCKDFYISSTFSDGAARGLDGRFYRAAPVGKGDVKIREAAEIIIANGYNGFADIEYIGRDEEPAEAIKNAADWMRKTTLFI